MISQEKQNACRFLGARFLSSACSDRVSWAFSNLYGDVWTCKNDLKTVTCRRGSFCNRENVYVVSNLHGYVWTWPRYRYDIDIIYNFYSAMLL